MAAMTATAAMDALAALVARRTGLLIGASADLPRVSAWLEARAHQARIPPLAMVERVARHADLWDALLAEVTNGQTAFFRDPEAFDVLAAVARERALPAAIWSAACSTGQEAWSIALAARGCAAPVEVLGTDLNPAAVAAARAGVYDAAALEGVPPELLEAHFVEDAHGRRRVVPPSPVHVDFQLYNLVTLAPPRPATCAAWDVIFCRHVLIYFSPADAARIVRSLASALAPGGILVLGASEGLHGLDVPFERTHLHGRVLYRLRDPARPSSQGTSLHRSGSVSDAQGTEPGGAPHDAGSTYLPPSSRPAPATSAVSPVAIEDARAWSARGHAFMHARAFDAAARAYRQALASDATSLEARLGEALLQRHRGDHEAACRSLEHVLTLEPRAWPASFLLIDTYTQLERTAAALQERQRARRILYGPETCWRTDDPALSALLPDEQLARVSVLD